MIIKSNKIKVKMFYNCIYGGKKWVITLQDYSYIIATQYFKDYMQGQIVCGRKPQRNILGRKQL